MDDEERRWISGSQNGDSESFGLLVQKHQRMIHSLAFRMTGSLADAEDLAQETFIQAFRQIVRFRGDSAFSSWLYRIAVNTCLNWRKREFRRGKLHEEWHHDSPNNAAPDDRIASQVQEALMKLDPKQRAAIVLTVYDGLNHADAARALGCSETTVSWRIFAARKKLKKWLQESGHP